MDTEDPPAIVLPDRGPARRWPHLVVMDYPVTGEVFRLVQPETIVGRSEDADIRPFHRRVSRKHARLTVVREGVLIEDLGSSNGTFLGGDQVLSQRLLNEGDRIVLGGATALGLTYSTILDEALRARVNVGEGEGSVEIAKRAARTAAFFDLVRIHQVRARMFRSQFTLALFRVGCPTRQGDVVNGAALPSDQAMRTVVAALRGVIPAEHAMARPSSNELVVLARLSAEQLGVMADRVRLDVERVSPLSSRADVLGTTLTAAILPLPLGRVLAPETILCAAGDQGRHAMAGETNRVLILPKLDIERQQTTKDEASSS